MIREDMLKEAAAEADRAIRDALPAPAECKHEFPLAFQRKMRRIFRKARHPGYYKLLKFAAGFVLTAVLAGSAWLTVDAKARAAFSAWMRERHETFAEYRFSGKTPQKDEAADYE